VRLQFLGTGGSQPIPLPTCDCGVCREAVERGVPYARHGYQLHLPGIDAVVDAPEAAPENLVRWGVDSLRYCLLTHWHPDHAAGLRVLSMRPTERADSETFRKAKRRTAPTLVTTRGVYRWGQGDCLGT
jgi:phosphoribosyl 1,2-cyclic phosphodiesterase